MKNKKGFTLVELLAVIAILALLVIIAMPNILKRFNQAKKDTFITEVKKVYSEVTDAYVNNTLSGNHKTLYSSETNDLDMTGDIKYCVVTDTQGNIEYMEVSDESYYSTYDKTKQIEKYNSSDANDLPEDYSMNCKSISKNYNRPKVEPKYCKSTVLGKDEDEEYYYDDFYIYRYNKEYVWEIEISEWYFEPDGPEWKNTKTNGYSVKLKSIDDIDEKYIIKDKDENEYIEKLDIAPCTYIDDVPITSMANMFQETGIMELDLSNFNTSNVVNMQGMFSYFAANKISNINYLDTSNVKDMSMMFFGSYIKSIDKIGSLDTLNVTDMRGMFAGFYQGIESDQELLYIDTIDLSGISEWNVDNVKHMEFMFAYIGYESEIKNLNLGNLNEWKVGNVTSMLCMFYNSLSNPGENPEDSEKSWNIDISRWDVSNVTNMSGMFAHAGDIAKNWSIGDISNWDTSKVKDMSAMFMCAGGNSTNFNIGDIGKWDVSNVTNMYSMFDYAGSYSKTWYIGKLDTWNTSKVANMTEMFAYTCNGAEICNYGDLSTKEVTVNGKTYTAWDLSNIGNALNTEIGASEAGIYNMFKVSGENAKEWRTGNIYNWNVADDLKGCYLAAVGKKKKEGGIYCDHTTKTDLVDEYGNDLLPYPEEKCLCFEGIEGRCSDGD